MRLALLAYLLLCAVIARASEVDSLLTESSLQLKKTKQISSANVTALRKVVASKEADAQQRLFAAQLVSMSPVCSGQNSCNCPEQELLFNHREVVLKVLGKKAAFEAARRRGDCHFDKGKFDPAIESYEFLALASGGQHDYAVLRLGWSHLNKKDAAKAFPLWSTELRTTLKRGELPSRNLVHGLGVSFSENLKRSDSDVKELNEIKLSKEDTQTLIEGILEGLYFLNDSKSKQLWTEQVQTLKVYPGLVRTMLVENLNTSLPNCDFLPLLQDKKVFSSLPAIEQLKPLLQQCVTLYEKKHDTGMLHTISDILDKSDATQKDPFYIYNFFSKVEKHPLKACKTGIIWAFNEVNAQKVALKDISADCLKVASEAAPVLSENLLIIAGASDAARRNALKSQTSSAMILLGQLSSHPQFEKAIITSMETFPAAFSNTLLPPLIAEQLGRNKRWGEIYALHRAVGTGNVKTAVWNDASKALLLDKISRKEFAGTNDLIDDLGILNNLDANNLSLILEWCRTFYKDNKSDVTKVIAAVPSNLKVTPNLEQQRVMIELLLTQERFSEMSRLVERFGFPAKLTIDPSFDPILFDKIADRDIVWNLERIKNPYYERLGRLATMIAHNKTPAVKDFDIKGSGKLHQDLETVKRVFIRSDAATKERKSSLDNITHWVTFLQSISEVAKRQWISEKLFRMATLKAEETQAHITQNLPKLKPNKDIPPDEWNKIVLALNDKVAGSTKLLQEISAKVTRRAE